ncbi:MAG: chorismate mutase [Alphaproteobacteria bacterium]
MTTAAAPSLDDLRRRIDAIDDALLDLVQERTSVVQAIGALKRGGGGPATAFRPGREATVMRRLAARHAGPFSIAAMVRLWREMMCEFTRLQGPFAIAVHDADGSPGLWDLARDHFGSQTPMATQPTPSQVIHAVTDGAATVGILPLPSDERDGRWWTGLLSEEKGGPRIIARLPFVAPGNARGGDRQAVAVACLPTEPSGDDRSYLAIDLSDNVSRSMMQQRLREAGLGLASLVRIDQGGGALHLAEVDGYLEDGDPRLASLGERLGARPRDLRVLGAYAVPMAEAGAERGSP